MGGLNWALITIVGAGLLAVILFWAMLRNKTKSDQGIEHTEEATRQLYREEDAARDPENDYVP